MRRETAKTNEISFIKALGEIGPPAIEALPDIKHVVEKLVENACDGKNRQQLEIAVQVMCKLARSSDDINARFYKWRTGCSDGAIAKLMRRELTMARDCKHMPVRSICESMASLGNSCASASDELMAFVRDTRENIETRGAAALLLETTGSSAKFSPSDKQLIKEVFDQSRPPPPKQIIEPYYRGTPDSSTIPSR
jgi:hypothetical protein